MGVGVGVVRWIFYLGFVYICNAPVYPPFLQMRISDFSSVAFSSNMKL